MAIDVYSDIATSNRLRIPVTAIEKSRQPQPEFTRSELSRIIEMAWEDRTPFEAIEFNYGLNESSVINLMRREMKARSFRLWRKRVTSRKTKHQSLRSPDVSRGYCPTQYKR